MQNYVEKARINQMAFSSISKTLLTSLAFFDIILEKGVIPNDSSS